MAAHKHNDIALLTDMDDFHPMGLEETGRNIALSKIPSKSHSSLPVLDKRAPSIAISPLANHSSHPFPRSNPKKIIPPSPRSSITISQFSNISTANTSPSVQLGKSNLESSSPRPVHFDVKVNPSRNKFDKTFPTTPSSRFATGSPSESEMKIDIAVCNSFDKDSSSKSSYASSLKSTPRESKVDTVSSQGAANENYVYFRTRSQKSERQRERDEKENLHPNSHMPEVSADATSDLPTRRYFDALQGPELEVLRESEDTLLPKDKTWPFLLRFPISSFGICLGLGSQAILWKNLSVNTTIKYLHVPSCVNVVIWTLALLAYVVISCTYMAKVIYYFEAVRREYHHPVRVNFFFAPWVAAMFLALGMPPAISTSVHPATWCVCMSPLVMLELKIYGQWLSGGDRRLSKVANPSTHLSIVGNFIGALLSATVGWKEPAIFFWAVGLAHYIVLFVTLYQRLPTNEALSRDLHPVFFLFVAAPSSASIAWEKISGDFGFVSKIMYFIALFLYCSLVVRITFFTGCRFSIAWWAYTFPMAAISVATLRYAHQVQHPFTNAMAVVLSLASTASVIALFISTLAHLVFWGTLFPNDLAIAITRRKQKIKILHKTADLENNESRR